MTDKPTEDYNRGLLHGLQISLEILKRPCYKKKVDKKELSRKIKKFMKSYKEMWKT